MTKGEPFVFIWRCQICKKDLTHDLKCCGNVRLADRVLREGTFCSQCHTTYKMGSNITTGGTVNGLRH